MRDDIPGPKGRFMGGNLREVRERPLEYALELTRRYGDVIKLRLGPQRCVMVNHPDHVKRVLQEKNAIYGRPPFVRLMRRVLGNGLFFSEGEMWLRQRRTLQPLFTRERVLDFVPSIASAVAQRTAAWQARAPDAPLDLTRELRALLLDIVGRTLFSTDLSSTSDELARAIQTTLEWLDQRASQPLSAPLFIPTADNRRFKAAQRVFADALARMSAARRNAATDDLLSLLLSARDPETGGGLAPEQIQAELMTFLIAGYETTSSALEWSLWLLANHPAVAARVRAEQHAVCGDSPPSAADLPSLTYTKMVIDEALRLYPPAFGITRRANAEDEIAGYRIPKGTMLVVSTYALQRAPERWPDPDTFDPERFAPELVKQRSRFAYVPFGVGPRQCIGNALASLELQIIVATVLGKFHLELTAGCDATPDARMTLRPRGPIMMRLSEARRSRTA